MSELYEPECISLNYRELLAKSKELTFAISVSQQASVEHVTRKQSDSRVWFRFWTGHITASKMHNILHTNSDMPSVSLIKSISYPESYRFSAEATKWGCQHEKLALDAYQVMKENRHLNFHMVDCGFFYFDRSPIYWCVTRFFNMVRLLWWGMCRGEVSLLRTKWHSWRSIE